MVDWLPPNRIPVSRRVDVEGLPLPPTRRTALRQAQGRRSWGQLYVITLCYFTAVWLSGLTYFGLQLVIIGDISRDYSF